MSGARVLDVTDTDDIARLADELRARHGGVDVVLSNAVARLLPEESQAERADEFIDVSNTATHAILRSFGPVLRPGGRLDRRGQQPGHSRPPRSAAAPPVRG